jgi:hypothetical protein
MKINIKLNMCAIVFFSLTGFSQEQNIIVPQRQNDQQHKYISPKDELVLIPSDESNTLPIQQRLVIFPKELFWGDTIYTAVYSKNISINTIEGLKNYQLPLVYQKPMFNASINIEGTTILRYKWITEYDTTAYHDVLLLTSHLLPGTKNDFCKGSFEFPPLEDMEHPFWKEVLSKMTPDGVCCRLHFEYEYWDSSLQLQMMNVDEEIRIKPRPESEMALLKKWYKNTPEKLFPIVKGNRKIPKNNDSLFSNYRTNITVGGLRGNDPWSFIRLGYRKPSDSNCPTTIEGWRELESGLIPSTMRDEICLIRMQLEYYGTSDQATSDLKRKALGDWLKSLPESQQSVMISYLVDLSSWYQGKNTLRPKYIELLHELYDLLDNHGKRVAYSLDKKFPSLVGKQKTIEEIIKPMEAELAMRDTGKEPEDGFRVWKIHSPNGNEYLFVAKFNSLTDDNALEFMSRDGRRVLFEMALLDIKDIIYIEQTYPGKLPQEDYREWKGEAEGLPVTATYFGISGGMVRMKKKDEYKSISFDFNKISNEDQLYVQSRQKKPKEFMFREWTVIYVDGESAQPLTARFVSTDEENVTLEYTHGGKITVKLSRLSEKDRDYINLCKIAAQKKSEPVPENDDLSKQLPTLPTKTDNSGTLNDTSSSLINNVTSSTNTPTLSEDSSVLVTPPSQKNTWGWTIIATTILLLIFLAIIVIYVSKTRNNER